MKKNFIMYFWGLVLSIIFLFIITFIFNKLDNGVLFFSAFIIAFISSILGGIIYFIKSDKDYFKIFVVTFSYILFNSLFIYLGPVTVDRSLSSFIFFYSVENGKITENIYDETYFRPYVQRRFDDGEKIGYLKCENSTCIPTNKAKITYYILYPICKLTGTLKQYENFKSFYKK